MFPDPAPATAFTLAALIESLNMKSGRVAVELNREIVPRNLWPQTPLKEGDHLEIVHFVGGGASPDTHLSSGAEHVLHEVKRMRSRRIPCVPAHPSVSARYFRLDHRFSIGSTLVGNPRLYQLSAACDTAASAASILLRAT